MRVRIILQIVGQDSDIDQTLHSKMIVINKILNKMHQEGKTYKMVMILIRK
jgi:hypothetical protein